MLTDLLGKAIDAPMTMTAIISDCTLYRYEAERVWDDSQPILIVAMLNPSRADHRVNDPTVLALIHFARLWGYGGIRIVNLNAFRSPSPAAMMAASDPFGPLNHEYIARAMSYAAENGQRLLVAWGNGGDFQDRAEWFSNRALQVHKLTLVCLGRNRDGSPKHPMARGIHRIPRDQQMIVWREPASL